MKIRHLIIIIFGILIFSCESEIQPPIADEKLIEILADVHLSESAAQSLPMKQKDSTMAKYYEQVMEIHEVSRADFDSTMVLLKLKPAKMAKVYEKVLEQIDKNKTDLTQ